MGFVSRGFRGKRRDESAGGRLPPGQYLVNDWPVLSAGPTPRIDLDKWSFTLEGEIDQPKIWTWREFTALPSETITKDIHCVTKWSKFDVEFKGVSLETLLEGVETAAEHTTQISYGGYTTNVPLDDLRGSQAWIIYQANGEPLAPEHGGPARMLIPHLYFWKSAKWIRALRLDKEDIPGFWETNGYNNYGDPWREQRYWGD
jgi:DMSO/TMAO reductase YedYZ molybdopterin-dependent catalytic subunit